VEDLASEPFKFLQNSLEEMNFSLVNTENEAFTFLDYLFNEFDGSTTVTAYFNCEAMFATFATAEMEPVTSTFEVQAINTETQQDFAVTIEVIVPVIVVETNVTAVNTTDASNATLSDNSTTNATENTGNATAANETASENSTVSDNSTAVVDETSSTNSTESAEVAINDTIDGNATTNATVEPVTFTHTTTVGIPEMSEADKADLAAAEERAA
jgi:hypothetical protein